MKNYTTYSSEDFACDDDFFKWVKYPGRYPDLDSFWVQWLEANPDKGETVQEARHMILAITTEPQYLSDEARKQALWERIKMSAEVEDKAPDSDSSRVRWYSAAAVFLLLAIAGWLGYSNKGVDLVSSHQITGTTNAVRINNTNHPKTVVLSDGTSVILKPESRIEYPLQFKPDSREVSLNGEAFFEVVRDPARPFMVRAGDIVTRVLGTSFTVRNFEGENNVLVQVKTGKVSVFRAEEVRKSTDDDNNVEGVVLMPNQQVLYERHEMKMTKSLVENPRVLAPNMKHVFEFVDTPIKDVFAAIEKGYGVDLVYDEEVLSGCYLNASLTDVALYDKLKLICKGINATYEVMDSHIIIYGGGCSEGNTNPNPF